MREIKFRAWNGEEMCNGWLLSLSMSGQLTFDSGECGEKVIDWPIMQFTGLLDKNGKEIYEGDIIEIVALADDHHQRGATNNVVVRYFAGNPSLCFAENESGVPIFPFNVTHELEVIGNIYEDGE